MQQGMGEQELADKVGCTAQCIRDYESGARSPQQMTLHTLNDVLNGRNSWGFHIVDSPKGAESVFLA
ncbi:hypothetical protein BG61_34995 [Caballeronia glathei]|uniref:HTH cro/C1-type domain-containing protein n=2 Tax=Caballeronia glathei TaxID=60547 RepID=A0A069PGU2_9BURK|nr:hypothetical protein BG61_34995 [Caballeronia glathei]